MREKCISCTSYILKLLLYIKMAAIREKTYTEGTNNVLPVSLQELHSNLQNYIILVFLHDILLCKAYSLGVSQHV